MAASCPRWFREQVPLRGTYLAVQWGTHDGGAHLTLARTEHALAATWRQVLGKIRCPSGLMLAGALRLQFVAPPEKTALTLDEEVFEGLSDIFRAQLACAAFGASCDEVCPQVPAVLEVCRRYRPERRELASRRHAREKNPLFGHAFCTGCSYGLRWPKIPASRQRQAWRDAMLRPAVVDLLARLKRDDGTPRPERPQRGSDPEPTHILISDFGHHRRGIVLEEVGKYDPKDPMGRWCGWQSRDVIAFALAEPLEFPAAGRLLAEARQRQAEEEAAREAETKQYHGARAAEQRQEDQEAMEAFLKALRE